MSESKIKSIRAREILDSRGNPTLEVDLSSFEGIFRASVPSGASKGEYEAKELRDGEKRYGGQGVLEAVKNVNQVIAPRISGKNPVEQEKIDEIMINLDGTKDKSNLGANSILPVSLAVCRAGAAAKNVSLYQHLAQLSESEAGDKLPRPCFNIINGGAHSGNFLDIQEFMVVPKASSFSDNLCWGSEIYHSLEKILSQKFGSPSTGLGDEGGFAPPLKKNQEALDWLIQAVDKAGYKKKVEVALDCAANFFSYKGKYCLEGEPLDRVQLLNFYLSLAKNYPLLFLEDPFSSKDLKGWKKLNSKLEEKNFEILTVGDDLTATNPQRISLAHQKGLCGAVILKPNQIGTVTQTLKAAQLAKSFGWEIIVSHRSGETCDDFISDLAVGIGASFIKAGAPARGERVAKYNRLLRIEQQLKK